MYMYVVGFDWIKQSYTNQRTGLTTTLVVLKKPVLGK